MSLECGEVSIGVQEFGVKSDRVAVGADQVSYISPVALR